jgi:acyl-CoA thioester hydrolase
MTAYRERFRPRYYEIDRQGVMFNMWYLGYLDTGVGGFFAARGLPFDRWEELGFDIQVVHVELDYSAGLTDAGDAELSIAPGRIGTKSFTLEFGFATDLDAAEPTAAVAGRIVYAVVAPVVVGAAPSGAIAIPDVLRTALTA